MPSTPQPQPQPCFADDCWSDEPVGQCPLEPNSFCLAGLQCLACAVPLGMSPSLCNFRLSSSAFFCNHCGPTVLQAGGGVAWEHSSSGQAVYSCGGRLEGESIGASLGLFCMAMSASTQVGDLRVWIGLQSELVRGFTVMIGVVHAAMCRCQHPSPARDRPSCQSVLIARRVLCRLPYADR